jgi:DNA-binding IclR family transcriptional regulator
VKQANESNQYEIRVVTRAIQVLLCFVRLGPELSIDQIAAAVQLPKSTIYRILVTLEKNNLLERDPQRDIYRLGLTALLVGTTALNQLDLHKKVRPWLMDLMQTTGETVHLAVLSQGRAVIIDKIDSYHSVRMASTIGFQSPLHCTGVGKVLLAYQESAERERILRGLTLHKHTANTIVDHAQLKRELGLIRQNGYALDQEEVEVGLRCVAAPIHMHSGAVVASISMSGPASRVTEEALPKLIDTVKRYAAQMSKEIGYQAASDYRVD